MAPKGEDTRARIVAAAEDLILEHGYSGTSLDDVLRATELTKGAFFHHFRNKAELGMAIAHRYAETIYAQLSEWSSRADGLSDDPLERVLIFLRLYELYLDTLDEPLPGCIFASFIHERAKFDPEIHVFIREGLDRWQFLYERKFISVLAVQSPNRPVTSRELAEMVVTLIEGGLFMGNAFRDRTLLQRQLRLFRDYVELLFSES